MRLEIPGREALDVTHLVLDYNGTIATGGRVIEGVAERLAGLAEQFTIHVLTADTYGSVHAECDGLGVSVAVIGKERQDEAKLAFINALGIQHCIAVGNGRNDALMLSNAALGIALVQEEGCSTQALMAADLFLTSINDALDALLHPERLAATLRN